MKQNKSKQRNRRVSWRSHRHLRQVLFAFSTAGLGLGIILLGFSFVRHIGVMVWLGLGYIFLAIFLMGVRGILGHLDDLRHRRHYRSALQQTKDFG